MAAEATARAAAVMGETEVALRAKVLPGGAVRCHLECNGQVVTITFHPDDVDVDVLSNAAAAALA